MIGNDYMSAKMKVVTAHLPISLVEQVDSLAEQLERPKAWIIKQALSAWVEQENERHRLTLEAMADVEAGNFVDDEAVQAWANSLDSDNPLPLPR